MAYQGGPGSNGYWNEHEPPSTYGPQETRSPYLQPPQASYPTPGISTAQSYPRTPQHPYGIKEYAHNEYYSPATVQPQEIQPQFITPAQIFQQPPPPTTHLNPASLSRTLHTPSSKNPANMGNSQSNLQPPDKSMLLLALAEEYFEAAHALAPSVTVSMTQANIEAYDQLMATGLGCLDTVLKRVKLAPRLEANVRLRYASVLHEETENYMEAETTLSKGIGLCERNHYFDLKYAMQYLLAQLLAKKNPKAAIKTLDTYISEAEAYQHISWVYALRFLRASYSLDTGNTMDNHAAILNLTKISELANQQGDRAVHLVSSLWEAMVHLRSTGQDAIEQVQRALAAARTHQLDVGKNIPQLNGLTHIIDVMCSIRQVKLKHMVETLRDMQLAMDSINQNDSWSECSDVIAIPINRTPKSSSTVSHETRAVLGIGQDGRDNLMISFLNRRDAYAITYLICATVMLRKNPNEPKGDQYLEIGLGFLNKETKATKAASGILPDMVSKHKWRGQMICYVRLYMGFSAAARGNWVMVLRHIESLKSTAKEFEIPISGFVETLATYLTGVYYQGTGDLESALQIFQDERFNLPVASPKGPSASSADQVERDFALLAALNTLWILQDPQRQNVENNANMLAKLEPICAKHPNIDIQTAFNLAIATVKTNPPSQLFTVKKHLGAALQGAQSTTNTQFLCLVLNVMCSKFFSSVVGSQAEKSAQAASVQAAKSGSVLWRSVADGMLSRSYEVSGKKQEAQASLEDARKFAQMASSQMTRPGA